MPENDDQPEGFIAQTICAVWLCYLMAIRAALVSIVVAGTTGYLALVYYGVNGRWP